MVHSYCGKFLDPILELSSLCQREDDSKVVCTLDLFCVPQLTYPLCINEETEPRNGVDSLYK